MACGSLRLLPELREIRRLPPPFGLRLSPGVPFAQALPIYRDQLVEERRIAETLIHLPA
jgi:hypothetical protein